MIETIESAYAAATGVWTGWDWTMEIGCDGDEDTGEHLYSDGGSAAQIRHEVHDPDLSPAYRRAIAGWLKYAASAEEDAEAAESYAGEALAFARAGDLARARQAAKSACGREAKYGAAPTWGPFLKSIENSLESTGDEVA